MKKRVILVLFVIIIIITSCSEGKLVFPYEADLEKYFSALLINSNGENLSETDIISTDENVILLENNEFSVWISENDALSFYVKSENAYYDTFGEKYDTPNDAKLNLSVKSQEGTVLEYEKGEFYDIIYEKYRKTATVFYLNSKTVRIIYILGLSQLENIGETPNFITQKAFKANELIYSKYFTEGSDNSNKFATEFLSKQYYIRTEPLPEAAKSLFETNPNFVKKELLELGYNPESALILLVTVDITLENDGILFDISPNRQYKSLALRTSEYNFSPFSFNLDFMTKTESESEKITFAGSKY